MARAPLALLAVAALSLPVAARAQSEWGDDVQPAGDYDVSVDLNPQGGVGLETFQGPLQPYGDWVVVGNYGQVWRPRVAAGWRPYYYGRWEWTNEGWFWVSDEPWGWAAYHYGRWAYDPYYGWIWVPGYEWAPAWVSWRSSGDAVGWAPLAPGYSVYVTTYPYVDAWWTFVPCNRFVSVPVYSVAYAPVYARRWYDTTAPAPAFAPRAGAVARGGLTAPAWGGPAPRSIEQRLGRPLAPARIVQSPTPGDRGRPGEIAIYRPERAPPRQDRPAFAPPSARPPENRGAPPAWGARGGGSGGWGQGGNPNPGSAGGAPGNRGWAPAGGVPPGGATGAPGRPGGWGQGANPHPGNPGTPAPAPAHGGSGWSPPARSGGGGGNGGGGGQHGSGGHGRSERNAR